jgi:hypothetical protein
VKGHSEVSFAVTAPVKRDRLWNPSQNELTIYIVCEFLSNINILIA